MEQSTVAAKIDELETHYRISEPRLKDVLAAHPEMVDILLEAYPHIERIFGKGVPVAMQFFPEFEGVKEREIMVDILAPLDVESAHNKFNQFWEEWWCEASGRSESFRLFINVHSVGEHTR